MDVHFGGGMLALALEGPAALNGVLYDCLAIFLLPLLLCYLLLGFWRTTEYLR
jgi:hypothetical protein